VNKAFCWLSRKTAKQGRGGEAMKELTVITPNKPGVIASISSELGAKRINIESISTEVSGDTGVIHIITRDGNKARKLIESLGYKVVDSDILVLRLQDRPGELAKVSSQLAENGVNIENVYMLSKERSSTLLALKVDNMKRAATLLRDYIKK
jgi:hypothetical protein